MDDGKRGFLKQAALFGAAAGAAGAAMAPDATMAQMLETGVRDDSVLAKCRKEGVLRVGYAQTGPWFYKDAKTGELNGIYKDVVEQLAQGNPGQGRLEGSHVRERRRSRCGAATSTCSARR